MRKRTLAWTIAPAIGLRMVAAVVVVAASLVAAVGSASASTPEIPCSEHTDPRLQSMTDDGIELTSTLGLAPGRFALPSTAAPTQLVVFFHGHGNDSCGWRGHLQRAAARGAVAVAMDYTPQRQTPVENYGWFVRAGAADSIAAANHFLATYPSITEVFALGISMGGNAAGVAMASPDAVRADGSPLFDYFVDVEGVNSLIEEYLIARSLAPVNGGAALATQEIEEENGGPIDAVPERYLEINNVTRAPDMAELKGAVIVNGLDDGLVPTNQSPEMTAALLAAGVPTHSFTVLGTGGAEAGTTGTGIVATPLLAAFGQEYEAPLAGHGWEGSETHLVIKTGFDQLWALMAGGTVEAGETVVPGI